MQTEEPGAMKVTPGGIVLVNGEALDTPAEADPPALEEQEVRESEAWQETAPLRRWPDDFRGFGSNVKPRRQE